MNTYAITYRKPDGTLAERHVQAANHKAAADAFLAQGLGEPIRVERSDSDYSEEPGRRVGSPVKSVVIALAVGALAAVGVVAASWWRRGCPPLW